VVCNADPLTAYPSLIPPEHRPAAYKDDAALVKIEPSTSAFVLLLGVRGDAARDFGHLSHYNSFLPDDATAEFHALFDEKRPPTIP
jgi:phytoene dehydrogenase-like protein